MPSGVIFSEGDHDFNKAQATFWTRLAEIGYMNHGYGVLSSFSTEPLPADVIRQELHFEHGKGELEHMISMPEIPRLWSVVRMNGIPIGQAIIIPTCAAHGNFGCPPVPVARVGHKIGKIGIFIKEEHRRQGHGRRLLQALSFRIMTASRKRKMCLIAAARLLPLAKSIFNVPVIAPSFLERTNFEIPN